ncbi:MAG: MBL fold metallo-hydrolase [Bacteroidia bacterium]|nr:MBL fold metallo-hydrolase [Bacteroidia bacterium]
MKIEQIYTGCLSHAAYYLESMGEAAIFDPLREVQPYIDRANKDGAVIKYIFETHFHADFVSGHLDLAKKANATIVYGPTAKPNFTAIIANDNEMFSIGNCKVKAIHTPGHTLESTCYLIIDELGKDYALISGDTLFIGDVGRPDLAQSISADLSTEKLAGMLYDSLRNKIMPLSNHIIIYPNHGAGSACGKMMSKETVDTLGNQKKFNYALRASMTKDEFIKEVLSGLTPPPSYFPKNVLLNINGSESFDFVLERGMKALKIVTFELLSKQEDILILDTRSPNIFCKGFIPESINIGLESNFAMWVGDLISDINQKILLVTEKGREEESITRLARVGYDNVIGFLDGGFNIWKNTGHEFDCIERISADEFEQIFKTKNNLVIDVRKISEFNTEHIDGAINIPLASLNIHLTEIPKDKPIILYCASGYRSMIAASILKQRGWINLLDVEGGFAEISKTSLKKTKYIAPVSTL